MSFLKYEAFYFNESAYYRNLLTEKSSPSPVLFHPRDDLVIKLTHSFIPEMTLGFKSLSHLWGTYPSRCTSAGIGA